VWDRLIPLPVGPLDLRLEKNKEKKRIRPFSEGE
jgi:hypothetical protein